MAKVLVSFDDQLLRRIDRLARKSGLSRSAYLARLATREMNRVPGPGAEPAVRRALTALDALFGQNRTEEVTGAIRAERDSR